MGKQLFEQGVLQDSVFNTDETGMMPGDPDTVKVLVAYNERQGARSCALRFSIALVMLAAGSAFKPMSLILRRSATNSETNLGRIWE